MAETTRDEDRTEEDNRKGGRNVILLEEADISEGINPCSNSLYDRLFASKTFSIGTMGNALKAIWGNPERFSVSEKGDNSFRLFFNKEVDVLRIERGSPWLFKDYVLHVKRWKEESFKTLEVGRKLGENLDTVLEVGKFQMLDRETRIVKTKINIDVARQVRDQLIVAGPNKKEVDVALCYERLRKFCTYCAKLGHKVKNCHDLLKDIESDTVKEDDIGKWVKASQVRMRIYSERERTFNNSTQNQNKATQRKKKSVLNCLLEEFAGMSMQEGKQSLKPQDTGNKATPESPQSANSRTECMEIIIAGQSNTKEDEGQLMQFAIGQCLTTEKGRKWKRLARQDAVEAKLRVCGYENWNIVNPAGVAGGLLLAWKDSISVQIISSGEFFVAAEIKEVGSSEFEEFTTMSQHLKGKVVIAGDFNAITSQAEKEGGGQKSGTTIATFTNFIDSNELVDIGMVGCPFTWTNRRQREDFVKERLDRYLKTHKANSRKEIEDLQAKLEELRVAGINGGEEVTSLEEKLELAYLKEENYWREKSIVKWLKEGDQNTRFFHQKFQSRMRRNRIWKLVGRDNEIASKPEDIAKVAEDYFWDIFTSSCSTNPNPYLEDLEPKVTASMNRRLQRPVTMDEVKRATFSVHARSAPGDNGFTAKFFHFF
ncbi:uncharacterized protein [Arachis hypogaea]|uniref:uncharacterized protein n=1 Tax=Arachis hypogaea TaxID=3818 RepID=UPI003B2272FC